MNRFETLAFWRRLLARSEAVAVDTRKIAVDQDIVLAEQIWRVSRQGGRDGALPVLSVYQVSSDRITFWRLVVDHDALGSEEVLLWRGLAAARW